MTKFFCGVDVPHQFCSFFLVCVQLCVFTFWVSGCDVRYYFRKKNMFGSYFPPVVCRRAHVLFTHSGVQHIMRCVSALFFFVLLPVSLDCSFLIAPSVFSMAFFN